MEVIILGLTVPGLGEVCQQGARHHLLGRFFDGGSHCTVHGVAVGARGVEEILTAAGTTKVPSNPIDGFPIRDVSGRDGLRTVVEVHDLDEAKDTLAQWDQFGDQAALCLVLGDRDGQRVPTVILYARCLPSMGPMPPCELQDLEATWVHLAGGTPDAGRYLLEEAAASWDPELEQQLTERLRQLYGD